jgi:hypothetical protein
MLHPYVLACLAAACLCATPPAQAAMKPAPQAAASDIQRVGATCNYGSHLDVSGYCVDSMDYARICPPRFFAISFPNGNGFRCLPVEWQRSPGWFGDFFD